MEKYKIISKVWRFPEYGVFTEFEIGDSSKGDGYGIFFFVTRSGEVAVLNLLENDYPEIKNITEIFDELIKTEYNVEFYLINGLRHSAWRYFADKSIDGNIWHKNHMSGSPFKNHLTDKESYSMELLEKKEILVEAQPITFKKWSNLSREEKIKQMRLFLDNPVESSDYVLNNTFHVS